MTGPPRHGTPPGCDHTGIGAGGHSAGRIVVEAQASRQGELTPLRIQSPNGGDTWDKRSFGNVGVRVGALRKTSTQDSVLVEAWQNSVPVRALIRPPILGPIPKGILQLAGELIAGQPQAL